MIKANGFTTSLFLLGGFMICSGCSSSSFTGASEGKSKPAAAAVPAVPTGGQGDGNGDGNGDAIGEHPGTDDGAAGPNGVTNSGDASGQITSTKDCTAGAKPLNYNIILAFDNTGSQQQTDPGNVRGAGGQSFVDDFSSYLVNNPMAKVHMNVLGFNTASIRSANGWQALTPDHAMLIKSDIAQATASPNGNTAYSPALNDAATLFDEINAQTAGTEARNYLIFLTDGLPNADRTLSILQAVNKVVAKNAAIIAIASGPDVPLLGEATVRGLAQPTVAGSYPDLVGQYYRAVTPLDLKAVWSSLSTKISSSCSKSP